MVDFNKILEYRKMIRELLEQRPELIPLQEEINLAMSKAGSSYNRMVIIHNMMMEKVQEMAAKMGELIAAHDESLKDKK